MTDKVRLIGDPSSDKIKKFAHENSILSGKKQLSVGTTSAGFRILVACIFSDLKVGLVLPLDQKYIPKHT